MRWDAAFIGRSIGNGQDTKRRLQLSCPDDQKTAGGFEFYEVARGAILNC